jgi:transposase
MRIRPVSRHVDLTNPSGERPVWGGAAPPPGHGSSRRRPVPAAGGVRAWPEGSSYRHPGRRPIDDRAAFAGIVLVLKTGISWNHLPTALVGCSGATCWRRLRDWIEAGVWPALHEQLLAQPRAAGGLDLEGCAVDGSHIRALNGGPRRPVAGRPGASGLQAPLDL